MGIGAVLLALSAVQAVNQIGAGYVQKEEANLNATLIEGKAGLIDVQKDIENKQYFQAKGQALSTGMARTAGAGLKPTGSSLAVMLDTQKQMSLDQTIGQFNLEQEKRYTLAEADAYRRQGKAAVRAGWSNAFSTMLKAGSQYAMYRGTNKPKILKKQKSSWTNPNVYKLPEYQKFNSSSFDISNTYAAARAGRI